MKLVMPAPKRIERPADGFGRRLWDCLDEAGVTMSWAAVGRFLGVTGPQVILYMQEDALPRMSAAIEMAKKFGVSVDWLLTGRGPKRPGSTLSPEMIQAVSAVERHCTAHDLTIPPEDKVKLVEFLIADSAGVELSMDRLLRKLEALHGLGLTLSDNQHRHSLGRKRTQ